MRRHHGRNHLESCLLTGLLLAAGPAFSDELFKPEFGKDGQLLPAKQVAENTTRGIGGTFTYDGKFQLCLEFDRASKKAALVVTDTGSRFTPSFSFDADIATDKGMKKMSFRGEPGRYPIEGDYKHVAKAGDLHATTFKRLSGKGDDTVWTPQAALSEDGKDSACAQVSEDKSSQTGLVSATLYWELHSDPRVSGNILDQAKSPATAQGTGTSRLGYDDDAKKGTSAGQTASASTAVAAAAPGVAAVTASGGAAVVDAGPGAASEGSASASGVVASAEEDAASSSEAREGAVAGATDAERDEKGQADEATRSRGVTQFYAHAKGSGEAKGDKPAAGENAAGEAAADAATADRGERVSAVTAFERLVRKQEGTYPASAQLWFPRYVEPVRNIFQYASSLYQGAAPKPRRSGSLALQ